VTTDLLIRAMTEADLVDLVRNEKEKPVWSAAQFAEELYHPHAWQFVACHDASSNIIGYVCCRTVAGEAEILKIFVSADSRGHGVGSMLLGAALQRMAEEDAARCFLEVRESNIIARNLYEKFGFRRIGMRRNYYSSPREDAIVYRSSIKKISGFGS